MGSYPALINEPRLPAPAPIAPGPSPLQEYAAVMGIKNQQQEQQARAQQMATGAIEQQGAQLQLQQQQQLLKDQQAFRTAMTDPANQGKTIGEVADSLANGGNISMQGWQHMKQVDIEQQMAHANLTEAQLKAARDTTERVQTLYNNYMDLPAEKQAGSWASFVEQIRAVPGINAQLPQVRALDPNQPMTAEQLSGAGAFIGMHNAYLDQETARRKAAVDLQTSEAGLKEKQATADWYAVQGGAPGVTPEAMQQADWLKKNPGKGPSDYKLWTLEHTPTAMMATNLLGGAQNSDALDLVANNYRQTGQMPAGFTRSPQTTSAIIARAAQLDQQAGGHGIAANKATLKSYSDSLSSLQKNFQQVSAFENTAGKNLDLFLSTAKGIVDSGSPLVNTPLRLVSDKMAGSENMAAFNAARQTALTEIAKVLNSSNASGVLSDSARHEVSELIGPDATLKQIYSAAGILKQDMANRHQSYEKQIQDVQDRIKGMGQTGSGMVTLRAPNGQTKQVPADQAEHYKAMGATVVQ